MQPPAIAVGTVQAQRRRPLPQRGHWVGPIRWSTWAIDWWGGADMQCAIDAAGHWSPPRRRPQRSWHVYAPGTGYRELHDGGPGSVEQLWFFFELARDWPTLRRPLTVIIDEDERLGEHVHAMAALQQAAEPGHELALTARALVVLGEIALASRRGGDGTPERPWRIGGPGAGSRSLLARVERAVAESGRRALPLDELAASLAMSTSSLCHRFKAETGLAVMAHVRALRVREAQRLLARPDATVKEVATRLGFSSPFHLSSLFRRHVGVTASEWMRQQELARRR